VTGDFSGPLDLRITVVTVNGTFSTDLFQVLEKSLYLEM